MLGMATPSAAARDSDREVEPATSRASPAIASAWMRVMLSSGGTEPDTWTWTPSDGSTTRGEVPALPMPSPVDGSGRSLSSGAGRHGDQPPLVRNRTRIFGARTPSRHVKPTIVTSAVSRTGVCHRSVPALASPRSLSGFSRIPTPEVASVWSSSRPSPLPSSELRARRIPAPVPVTAPGRERSPWRHAALVGVGDAARPSRRQKSLQSHPPHITSHRVNSSRLHAPPTTFAKAVTRGLVSPYRFGIAADPQHHEASSNDLFGRWLAHHNEQQAGEAGEHTESAEDTSDTPSSRASRRLPAAAVASSAVERDR